MQLLGLQGFWQHQVLRGVGSEGSRRYSALEGHGTSIGQHAPVFLPGERPLPDREAWQATGHRVAKSWTRPKGPCVPRRKPSFACGSSAPVRVECEGGVAAWLAGTWTASATGVMSLSESFFEPLVPGDQIASLASLSP